MLRPLERDSLQAQKNRSNSPIGPLLVQNAVSTVPATDRLATLQRHRRIAVATCVLDEAALVFVGGAARSGHVSATGTGRLGLRGWLVGRHFGYLKVARVWIC